MILEQLDAIYRDFVRQGYGRLPNVLLLPDTDDYVYTYEDAIRSMRLVLTPHRALTTSLRQTLHPWEYRGARIILSRFYRTPVFAWTPQSDT